MELLVLGIVTQASVTQLPVVPGRPQASSTFPSQSSSAWLHVLSDPAVPTVTGCPDPSAQNVSVGATVVRSQAFDPTVAQAPTAPTPVYAHDPLRPNSTLSDWPSQSLS